MRIFQFPGFSPWFLEVLINSSTYSKITHYKSLYLLTTLFICYVHLTCPTAPYHMYGRYFSSDLHMFAKVLCLEPPEPSTPAHATTSMQPLASASFCHAQPFTIGLPSAIIFHNISWWGRVVSGTKWDNEIPTGRSDRRNWSMYLKYGCNSLYTFAKPSQSQILLRKQEYRELWVRQGQRLALLQNFYANSYTSNIVRALLNTMLSANVWLLQML